MAPHRNKIIEDSQESRKASADDPILVTGAAGGVGGVGAAIVEKRGGTRNSAAAICLNMSCIT